MLIKVDFHVHSFHSKDGLESAEAMAKKAAEAGLDAIALTDHNTMKGCAEASRAGKKYGILVIPSEEIKTLNGDILALGISKEIARGLAPEETVKLIHRQKGLAVPAHPYSSPLLHPLSLGKICERLDIDAIEAFNARTFFGNNMAMRTAEKLGLPVIAGSDAHMLKEIGNAYTIVDAQNSMGSILSAVKKGKTEIYGRKINPAVAIEWYARRVAKKVNSLV